jgi:hypothetical protein
MFSYPLVSHPVIKSISKSFIANSDVNLLGFLLNLLHTPVYKDDLCTLNIIQNARGIVDGFNLHTPSKELLLAWVHTAVKTMYSTEIKQLIANKEWQFNASQASALQIQEFRIEDMATKMQGLAPELWGILDLLLMGEQRLEKFGLDAMDVDRSKEMKGDPEVVPGKHKALCTIVHVDTSLIT